MPSSQQIADKAGITYRQLDHWVTKGWLRPRGSGSGSDRYWTPAEEQCALDMGSLTRFGVPPELAHRIARAGQAKAVAEILAQVPQEDKK